MLRCRGYIFFGSTLKILNDVMGSVVLPPELQPTLGKHKSSVGSSCASLDSQPGGGMGSSTGSVSASPGGPPKPTKFVLFDFSAVSGLDATAPSTTYAHARPGGVTLVRRRAKMDALSGCWLATRFSETLRPRGERSTRHGLRGATAGHG